MINRESRRRGRCRIRCVSAAARPSGKWRRCSAPGIIPRGNELHKGDFLRPLSPLQDENFDDKRYFEIDSSCERFRQFTESFTDPTEWTSRGHLITVAGDRGYGKTSLMQRCAAWLRDHDEEMGQCEVVTVDLSDEGPGAAMALGARVGETVDRILEAVAKKMRKEQLDDIKGELAAATRIRKLSTILSSRMDADGNSLPPIIVVVLLRRYSTPSEIDEYYNNIMRKGMIFFAEAYEKIDQIRALHSGFNRIEVNARMLELDVLKDGDIDLLVRRLRSEEPDLPNVSDRMIEAIERAFIPKRVSAGELARLASGVLQMAADQGAPELLQDHLIQYFADYYLNPPR
jgi:hypothetical protein